MMIDYTPEQIALRDQVRSLMSELMTDAMREELHHQEGGGPLYYGAMERIAAEGWLGFGWPTESGGQGRSPIEEFKLTRCFPECREIAAQCDIRGGQLCPDSRSLDNTPVEVLRSPRRHPHQDPGSNGGLHCDPGT